MDSKLEEIKKNLIKLEEIRQKANTTDSKSEERRYYNEIDEIDSDTEGLITEYIEENLPENIKVHITFDTTIDVDLWCIDDYLCNSIIEWDPNTLDTINLKELVLESVKESYDLYDIIRESDIKIEYEN